MKLKVFFPFAVAFAGMVLGAWVLIHPPSAKAAKSCGVCPPSRPYCCIENNTCEVFDCN